MNRIKNHLGGLTFLALALASMSSHATTFEAGVNWNLPGQPLPPPLFQPHVDTTQGPNGASAHTVLVTPFPEAPYIQRTLCGQSYYQTCEANASSSPASMTTYARNNGLGTISATAGFTDTFTNTSGQSQNYTFDFHLTNVNLYSRSFYGADVESRATANILINGVSVWNTSQSWLEDLNGSHFQSSGTDISAGSTITPWGYHQYSYEGSVNIGSFASGSSFTVQYVLSSYATTTDPYGCGFECQESTVSIDDPFSVNAASAIHITSSVPEPETYALFAAGLAMVVGARRRAAGSKQPTWDC